MPIEQSNKKSKSGDALSLFKLALAQISVVLLLAAATHASLFTIADIQRNPPVSLIISYSILLHVLLMTTIVQVKISDRNLAIHEESYS